MMAKKSVKDLKDTELKGKKVGSPLADTSMCTARPAARR